MKKLLYGFALLFFFVIPFTLSAEGSQEKNNSSNSSAVSGLMSLVYCNIQTR